MVMFLFRVNVGVYLSYLASHFMSVSLVPYLAWSMSMRCFERVPHTLNGSPWLPCLCIQPCHLEHASLILSGLGLVSCPDPPFLQRWMYCITSALQSLTAGMHASVVAELTKKSETHGWCCIGPSKLRMTSTRQLRNECSARGTYEARRNHSSMAFHDVRLWANFKEYLRYHESSRLYSVSR